MGGNDDAPAFQEADFIGPPTVIMYTQPVSLAGRDWIGHEKPPPPTPGSQHIYVPDVWK